MSNSFSSRPALERVLAFDPGNTTGLCEFVRNRFPDSTPKEWRLESWMNAETAKVLDGENEEESSRTFRKHLRNTSRTIFVVERPPRMMANLQGRMTIFLQHAGELTDTEVLMVSPGEWKPLKKVLSKEFLSKVADKPTKHALDAFLMAAYLFRKGTI